MTRKLISTSLLLAGVLNSTLPPRAFAATKDENQSALQAKAKVTEAQARNTALAKVPNGKIKEGELEEENGRLVWSFDITVSGSKNTTEVQVDANTGEVVSVASETPKEEAAEAKKEKKEKKH
jgi:predicted small secreted protein